MELGSRDCCEGRSSSWGCLGRTRLSSSTKLGGRPRITGGLVKASPAITKELWLHTRGHGRAGGEAPREKLGKLGDHGLWVGDEIGE